jgi:hypothetical protein
VGGYTYKSFYSWLYDHDLTKKLFPIGALSIFSTISTPAKAQFLEKKSKKIL